MSLKQTVLHVMDYMQNVATIFSCYWKTFNYFVHGVMHCVLQLIWLANRCSRIWQPAVWYPVKIPPALKTKVTGTHSNYWWTTDVNSDYLPVPANEAIGLSPCCWSWRPTALVSPPRNGTWDLLWRTCPSTDAPTSASVLCCWRNLKTKEKFYFSVDRYILRWWLYVWTDIPKKVENKNRTYVNKYKPKMKHLWGIEIINRLLN